MKFFRVRLGESVKCDKETGEASLLSTNGEILIVQESGDEDPSVFLDYKGVEGEDYQVIGKVDVGPELFKTLQSLGKIQAKLAEPMYRKKVKALFYGISSIH